MPPVRAWRRVGQGRSPECGIRPRGGQRLAARGCEAAARGGGRCPASGVPATLARPFHLVVRRRSAPWQPRRGSRGCCGRRGPGRRPSRRRRRRSRRRARRRRPRRRGGRSSGVMPPSTSMWMARSPIIARSARILSSWEAMNFWPPKPGLTVITQTRSTRSRSGRRGLGGRAGVEGEAGARAGGADRLEAAVGVRAGLGVDGDDVGAGGGEGVDVGVGRGDHQVDVQQRRRRGGASPSPAAGRR